MQDLKIVVYFRKFATQFLFSLLHRNTVANNKPSKVTIKLAYSYIARCLTRTLMTLGVLLNLRMALTLQCHSECICEYFTL